MKQKRRTKRLLALALLLASVLGLAGAFQMASVLSASVSAQDVNTHEIVFTIPVGEDGVHYSRVGPEILTWGPSAFTVVPDGSFWIADTVANRLLHYNLEGDRLNTINLNAHQVVGVGDLEISASDIFVLDIAAVIPRILRLSPDGELLASHKLPVGLRLENGLTGIAVGDQGELLVEREGGAFVSVLVHADGKVAPVALDGYIHRGRLYNARPADLTAADTTRGYITAGDTRIEVDVTHSLGGLRVLGVNADDSFYVIVDEVAIGDSGIQVDQTVHHYNAGGELLGVARVPLAERYTSVAHGLAMGPGGKVYALITHPDRVEVQRLKLSHELRPILPTASMETSPRSSKDHRATTLSCITRDSMMSTASGYTNNSKYLSATNTDGTCSGRDKPRYIGGAGTYSSVAYDWGGWDAVSGYNGYMSPNTCQAGDICHWDSDQQQWVCTVESCSRGTDCSGFVSRVWQLSSKHSTRSLPDVSWQLGSHDQLLRGDIMNEYYSHVVLFSSFGDNGIYDYEATTYNAYDRVVYMFSSWSRLDGYVPRRYNDVCQDVTPPAAPSNLSAFATGQTSIHLSWTDNSDNEDGFKIFRSGSHIATVGAGSTSYDDNGLSCGTTYSYYVKAYNSAGDSDPSNTDNATTDNCPPPPAPSLSSPPNGHTFVSCANITLDWNESSGASEYYAEYWGAGSDNWGWGGGTDWNIGIKSPGTYSWHAKARNEHGESDWSDTWSFTVNPNQTPNTPSPQSPGDGTWVNNRSPTLQWSTSSDDGCPRGLTYNAQIERITGGSWSTSISDHSGTSWSPSVPSDDDYRWRVQAHDGSLTSGWSGYRTVRVDATPPDTSITDGPSGVIPIGSATFTWTGTDNRTSTGDLEYRYRLVGLSNDWSSWSTATSVTYNDLTDGDYTFEVKAKDKAGNEDPSPATRSFGVDVTPPETTITSGPSGCIGTADVTFTWTGSDNRTPTAELLYSYKLEGFDADWSAWAGATSKSYTGLPDGDYTFKVKAKDEVGHEDPSPSSQSFRVDTTPPTGSILVNGGDSTTNKIAVHLDITGDDGPVGCGVTEMRLSNDGFNWEAWQPFATEGEWLLPTLNRTTWTVHLQLKDLVGNVSGAFTDDIYLDLYPPRPSSESYQLGARVVASADPTSISESYGLLSATMGQPIADGRLEGNTYHLESGYQGAWPSVPRGRPPAESYDINASLVASSGEVQASESYRLQSATGQSTDVGPRSSENYQLLSGYLPCKLLGDLDGNGRVDVVDIMMVASRWRCRSGDDCYHKRFDLDKDGDIDIVDIMLVVARWGEACE